MTEPLTAAPAPDDVSSNETQLVDLPTSDALTRKSAIEILGTTETALIVLAGEVGAGKTTALAVTYEMLRLRRLEGVAFAGSRTLRGLEERCIQARVGSGRDEPVTPRTSISAEDYLHLRLADTAAPLVRNLLISDISGERLRHVAESAGGESEVPALRRADFVCYLLDGEKLVAPALRQNEYQRAVVFLRRICERRVLAPHARIQIVVAKFDHVHPVAAAPEGTWVEAKVAELSTASFLAPHRIATFKLAARPRASATRHGLGLGEIIKEWLGHIDFAWVPPLAATGLSRSQMERSAIRAEGI